ncbi:MAG TPA: phospholipid carrier-dependent glycosyltransferase [Candidatus Dormibacteraeota bacterium]|nr:phospholipid carrier-dependent glycosyltransferase [Candidatus Dormibacteraeota bacterium]
MTGAGARGSEPIVRAGLRGFLAIERRDVLAVVALVLVSMAVRFLSPIYPNVLSASGSIAVAGVGYPVTQGPGAECAQVPVGPIGKDATGQVVDHVDVKRCGFVFDEVYFPVDAARDLRQPAESYFDPEPPLAKLLMAPPIATMGFTSWSWRVSTVIFGSLLVGLMYLMALRLRRDRWFATAAALLVSLDGLAFVESRTGVIDIIAIFFAALFFYVFLLHWQARTRTQWRATLYVMALVAGLAFAAKLTALAPLVIAAALIAARGLSPWIAGLVPAVRRIAGPRRHEAVMWREAAGRFAVVHYVVAMLIVGAVFCASFSRYLTIVHTDVYHFIKCDPGTAGLTAGSVDTLQVPTFKAGPLTLPNPAQAVGNIADITIAGLQYHEQECHSHPYASRWYTWPVMYHPVLFYYNQVNSTVADNPTVSSVTNMGNPAVWWLSIPALLACMWRLSRGPPWWRLLVALIGLVSLAVMIITFHAAQQPDTVTVRVNPGALFTLAFLGVAAFAGLVAVSAAISRRFVPAFIVLGYVTSWMLWVAGNERRVLFFYHALGMLLFAALALAYVLAGLRTTVVSVGTRRVPLAPVAWAGLIAVMAGFVFFYPVWTALPMPDSDHQMRLWVDAW